MSTIGSINPAALATPSSSTSTTTATNSSQTLTQQDFLKIMVAQFTQQDPLASDGGSGDSSGTSDYVNQLMSMTNLTTTQNISSQQGDLLAESLPGATVELNNNGATVTGVVSSASIGASGVSLLVNGQSYSTSDLISVDATAAQNAASAAAAAAAAAAATTSKN